MKTGKFMIAALVLATVGCASKKQSEPAASSLLNCGSSYCETVLDTNGDGIPDAPTGTGTNPDQTGYAYGSTASISLNSSALGRLFYNSRPVNPTNVRINISMNSATEAIIISYVENGILHEAAFGTQHPDNPSIGNAKYNGWVTENGQQVWKGFFQDKYGAIVLIVDKYLSQGDGQAANILGGSVWFQNFNQTPYDNPIQGGLKMCWEITLGPYDCRSFLVNGTDKNASVVMTSSQYPTTRGHQKTVSYERLGDFNGISRTASGF
jgi:hypothetical protein